MKKTKEKDFKAAKKRVGKEHLRRHKSKDEKLLSNLSRVKKTVKLSTQSISIKKDSLNVTSRRLTLPELVGKSRHTSENVRNHALVGLMEFTRRYEEEGRMNAYTLLQVACGSLLSEARQLRLSARNLLVSVLSTYFAGQEKPGSKCSEMVHLYLVQGILSSNGSPDPAFPDDVHTLLNLLIDRYPWLLREHYAKLLRSLLENAPESLSFKHFNAVYSLFKLHPELDGDTRADLVEYVIGVQYKLLTSAGPEGRPEPGAAKVPRRGGDRAASLTISNEIECLSNASIAVKSLKLLLANCGAVRPDDQRLVDLLLNVDLYEFENMTERGRDTFAKLFADFALTRTELSLRLLPAATRNHLPLLVPLIQFESLKASLEPSKVVQVLFSAINLNLDRSLSSQVKPEWAGRILDILADSKLNRVAALKTYLQNLKAGKNAFQSLNHEGNAGRNHASDSGGADLGEGVDSRPCLEELYREILDRSFNHVLDSPSVWPLVALLKGVPPATFPQIFHKSHHWAFLNEAWWEQGQGPGGGGASERPWPLSFDFEEAMGRFIPGLPPSLLPAFLGVCLHVSKHDPGSGLYYRLPQIPGLGQEHYLTLSRIFLNVPSSSRLRDFLAETALEILAKGHVDALREFLNLLLFHVFNLRAAGKLDPQGRVVINFDVNREVLDNAEYFMEFYLRLLSSALKSLGDGGAPEGGSPAEREASDRENGRSPEDRGLLVARLLTDTLRLLIDKYLLAMCRAEAGGDPGSPGALVQGLVEGPLRQYHARVQEEERPAALRALRAALEEYLGKDSIPEWVTAGCE